MTSAPTAGKFTIGTATVSPSGKITVGTYSGNGTNTATVAAHSAMDSATNAVVITYPLTIIRANGDSVSISVTQSVTKSKAGIDATNSTRITLYQRATSAPVTKPADGVVYTFSTGVFSGTTLGL